MIWSIASARTISGEFSRCRTKPTVAWNQVDAEFEGPLFSEYLRNPQPNPEERLQGLEQQEMLEDALQKLPVEMRRAIELCNSRDYSLKEAASALGLPVRTLKAHLHRGRRALMVHLKRKTQVRRKPAANRRSLLCDPAFCHRAAPKIKTAGITCRGRISI
jgi:DNA-directed RNA polymerase specialized sigma24 family protein